MKKKAIFIIILQVMFVSLVSISYAKYTSSFNGKLGFSVAKPISRVEINNDIYISNYEQRPTTFSVCNFDAKGNISEVKMNYRIIITVTQANAPLKYRVYRIYNNSQEEVSINNSNGTITQMNSVQMKAGMKETHNYKLEIEFDKSSAVELDENIEISIEIISEQERI